jgi:hypothetical protein
MRDYETQKRINKHKLLQADETKRRIELTNAIRKQDKNLIRQEWCRYLNNLRIGDGTIPRPAHGYNPETNPQYYRD